MVINLASDSTCDSPWSPWLRQLPLQDRATVSRYSAFVGTKQYLLGRHSSVTSQDKSRLEFSLHLPPLLCTFVQCTNYTTFFCGLADTCRSLPAG